MGELHDRVLLESRNGRDLANWIDRAANADEIHEILYRHRQIGGDAAATLLSIAARLADTEDKQRQLGSALDSIKPEMLELRGSSRPLGVPHPTTLPFEEILESLGRPEFIELIAGGAGQPSGNVVELIDLMYGSVDPLFGIGERLNRIEFVNQSHP